MTNPKHLADSDLFISDKPATASEREHSAAVSENRASISTTLTTHNVDISPAEQEQEQASIPSPEINPPSDNPSSDLEDKATPVKNWKSIAESVVGLAHRRTNPPLPCQDASMARHQPRLCLVLADGAGSAPLSDLGSQTAVQACQRICATLDDQIVTMLDTQQQPSTHDLGLLAQRLVWHVLGSLEDLAQTQRRSVQDFRCTLLLVLAGQERLIWVKVGDGAIVIEQDAQLSTLGSLQKGEFANQTRFIDNHLSPDCVEYSTVPIHNISGIALMSDGAAERLVASDGSRVAQRLADFFERLRTDRLPRTALTAFFYDADAWRGTSGDDKSLALAAT